MRAAVLATQRAKMKTSGIVLCLAFGTACSSSSVGNTSGTPDAAVGADSGHVRTNDTDAAVGADAGKPQMHAADAASDGRADSMHITDASTVTDASSVVDVGVGDAGEWQGETPPSGATRCGHGSFTEAEAMMACASASASALPIMTVTGCGAVTISGGLWEVWCGSSATDAPYVRVRYDGVLVTAGGGPVDEVIGWIDANGGGSGMTLAPGSGLLSFNSTTPTDAVLQSLGNTQAAVAGQGTVFLLGTIGLSAGSSGTPTVVSGVAISWDVHDGG